VPIAFDRDYPTLTAVHRATHADIEGEPTVSPLPTYRMTLGFYGIPQDDPG